MGIVQPRPQWGSGRSHSSSSDEGSLTLLATMLQELAILLLVGESFAQVNFDFDQDHDLMATDSRISEVQGDIRSLRQVNFEFDTDEDLLAVDSSLSNEIQDFPRGRKISPPPPAFRKIGDRLLTKKKIGEERAIGTPRLLCR